MDAQTQKKYNYWQWRTLIALMLGYVCYYFLRKNFSAAIPAMEQTLGLSKVQLGSFLTLNGIVYGVSRMINGFIADRCNRRRMMTLGLVLSSIINLAICFSPKLNGVLNLLDSEGKATIGLVYLIGSLWVVNGYVHGMGYPPCSSLMAHWFRPSELATKQSIWNASHSIGAGIVIALCGWILSRFGYGVWHLCFIVPAIISLIGAAALYLALRETPSSVGLPEIEELEAAERAAEAAGAVPSASAVEASGAASGAVPSEGGELGVMPSEGTAALGAEEAGTAGKAGEMSGEQFKKFLNRMVFRNPIIWVICLAFFCVYVIRFTILEWGTSFLTQYKGLDIARSASIVAGSEMIGGVLGTIVAGWFTDRFLKSKTLHTCAICLFGATVCFGLFWLIPNSAHWIWSAVTLILSAFFIYGPQALLGVSCSQYATKSAAGSANGLAGAFSYAATVISGIGFGFLADLPGAGWNAVFAVALGFGLLGTLLLLTVWKAPSDGYAKAAAVRKEIEG